MPQSEELSKAVGEHETTSIFRLVVDHDEKRGVLIRDVLELRGFNGEKESVRYQRCDIYMDGKYRTLSHDGVQRTDSQRKKLFLDFLKLGPCPAAFPFSTFSQNQDLENMLESRVAVYRDRGNTAELPDGTATMRIQNPTNPNLKTRTIFDRVHRMPIEFMLIDDANGKPEIKWKQTVTYREYEGVFVPVTVVYDHSSTMAFQEIGKKGQCDNIGTYELEWFKVNPSPLKILDTEEILKVWPASVHELMKSPSSS